MNKFTSLSVSVNENSRFEIIAIAILCGSDWSISVLGGTRHHIGSISIYDSNSTLTQCYPKHKDDQISTYFAQQICNTFHCRVVVNAGIHVDNASKEDIQLLLKYSKKCCSLLIKKMKNFSS